MPVGATTPPAQLTECLESIAAQSYRPLHLVAVLNPPDAELRRLLTSFASGSTGLTIDVVEVPRVGLPAALNIGLDRADDRLIARMDADDVMHPERIGAQVAVFERQPGAVVVTTEMEPFSSVRAPSPRQWTHRESASTIPTRSLTWQFLLRNPVNHPTVMLRRDPIVAMGGYNPRLPLCEDEDLWQRVHTSGGSVIEIRSRLLAYRVHGSSYSQTQSAMLLRSAIRVLLYYRNFSGIRRLIGIGAALAKAALIPARLSRARAGARRRGHRADQSLQGTPTSLNHERPA